MRLLVLGGTQFLSREVAAQAALAGHAADKLPAATAGGAPAHPVLLEHRYLVAALRQRKRRGEPGKSRPDHADIAVNVALQGWVLGVFVAGGRVIGRAV